MSNPSETIDQNPLEAIDQLIKLAEADVETKFNNLTDFEKKKLLEKSVYKKTNIMDNVNIFGGEKTQVVVEMDKSEQEKTLIIDEMNDGLLGKLYLMKKYIEKNL